MSIATRKLANKSEPAFALRQRLSFLCAAGVLLFLGMTESSWSDSIERRPLMRTSVKPIATGQIQSSQRQVPEKSDSQAEIALVNPAKGRYELRWIGEDGMRKEITYYEPDRISVVVQASVARGTSHRYRYEYSLTNRSTSGQDVFGAVFQTFAINVQVVAPSGGKYIGKMTRLYPEFSAGTWYRVPFDAGEVSPGSSQEIVLESDAPPGLVYVRAHGGPLGLKGIGEELPKELLAALPRYDAWPLGITIGPVASVQDSKYPFAKFGAGEVVRLMADAGWITGSIKTKYDRMIVDSSSAELRSAVAQDAEVGNVAPEVEYALNRLLNEDSAAEK